LIRENLIELLLIRFDVLLILLDDCLIPQDVGLVFQNGFVKGGFVIAHGGWIAWS
jgi:hypothetical protein